jgi:sugar transferase (PEP-CTERM/EpsH1 system associated)
MAHDPRPLVVHVLHRFDIGGLENGVVNLINHLPEADWRHAVVALTEVTDFRLRLRRSDVECVALNKPPGQGLWQYPRVWQLLRARQPAIVHTRNLAALEMQPAAWAAGVPVRIHGEHGRDLQDLAHPNARYRRLRRAYAPFVHRYVALSRDLSTYLEDEVGIAGRRIEQICNGVDERRFRPADGPPAAVPGCPFEPGRHWIVGTVGRMQPIKDPVLLARAFVQAGRDDPQAMADARLVLVGDGALRAEVQALLDTAGQQDRAWLPGERSDVPDLLRRFGLFVLPSRSEGISNGILEAMASGLPVLATAVGGNAELVEAGRTGLIVPPADVGAMTAALLELARDRRRAADLGHAGRAEVERRFGIAAMVEAYAALYRRELARRVRT